MTISKEMKLFFFFFIFCLFILGFFVWIKYQNSLEPKIILKSSSNPLEVQKPDPQNSKMSLDDIKNSLKNSEILNDKSLEVDDIR